MPVWRAAGPAFEPVHAARGTGRGRRVNHTAAMAPLRAGEAFEWVYGGGGGWGDPFSASRKGLDDGSTRWSRVGARGATRRAAERQARRPGSHDRLVRDERLRKSAWRLLVMADYALANRLRSLVELNRFRGDTGRKYPSRAFLGRAELGRRPHRYSRSRRAGTRVAPAGPGAVRRRGSRRRASRCPPKEGSRAAHVEIAAPRAEDPLGQLVRKRRHAHVRLTHRCRAVERVRLSPCSRFTSAAAASISGTSAPDRGQLDDPSRSPGGR